MLGTGALLAFERSSLKKTAPGCVCDVHRRRVRYRLCEQLSAKGPIHDPMGYIIGIHNEYVLLQKYTSRPRDIEVFAISPIR